jgi:hypothetical protein
MTYIYERIYTPEFIHSSIYVKFLVKVKLYRKIHGLGKLKVDLQYALGNFFGGDSYVLKLP